MCRRKFINRAPYWYGVVSFTLAWFFSVAGSVGWCIPSNNAQPVRVGVIAGLSGDYAAVFQHWVNGISLAHEDYQRERRSPAVELFVEDDQFTPRVGLGAYYKLRQTRHIDALLNGSSATIGAIVELVRRSGLPTIQMGEEASAPRDDNIVQIMPGNVEMERGLGAYLAQRYPSGMVVFYTAHATMIRFLEGFKLGYGKPLKSYQLEPTEADLRPHVLKALAGKPSCIVILAFPPQGAALVRAMRDLSALDTPLAFDANFQSGMREYASLLGDLSFLDSATVATLRKPDAPNFRMRYKQRFGEEAGIGSDWGFDAFNLLMAHYEPSPGAWVKRLKAASFEGASGKISFDQAGIRKPEFEIVTVRELRSKFEEPVPGSS